MESEMLGINNGYWREGGYLSMGLMNSSASFSMHGVHLPQEEKASSQIGVPHIS